MTGWLVLVLALGGCSLWQDNAESVSGPAVRVQCQVGATTTTVHCAPH